MVDNIMLASINNYTVKRLLANDHYVCDTHDGSCYLLCSTKAKRTLRNYRLCHLEGVVFPAEITYLAEGQAYECYPLIPSLSLCMSKLQTRLYTSSHLLCLFVSLCKTVMKSLDSQILRKELMTCLSWDNLWMVDDEMVLMWYPVAGGDDRKKDDVVGRLLEILKEMCDTARLEK